MERPRESVVVQRKVYLHQVTGFLSHILLDLSILYCRPAHQVLVSDHVLILEVLEAPLLIFELFLNDLLL